MSQLVSFVIPCYKSALTIGGVIAEITDAMAALPAYEYEIVLVKDCSPKKKVETMPEISDTKEKV